MFAPNGYKDIACIIQKLNLEAQQRLEFPSLDEVDVRHLSWLAWSQGELDFVEETLFETAVGLGMYACSPDGKATRISKNPRSFAAYSAVEMLRENAQITMVERIESDVSDRNDETYEAGFDPWKASRNDSYRRVPMCFTRAGYVVTLKNFDYYVQWLKSVGHHRLSEMPFVNAGYADAWRQLEGRSLCIESRSAAEIGTDEFWKAVQYSIYSAVWDNAEEMFADLKLRKSGAERVQGKIDLETRAFSEGEKLLLDNEYTFLTLEKLRNDIAIDGLGERAWRRVVERLRTMFPYISVPGRKS